MDEDTFQITNNSNDYFSFIENEIDECDLSFLEKEAYKNDKCMWAWVFDLSMWSHT